MRCGKAVGFCNICAELFKAEGGFMIRGLHTVLTAVCYSGTIPPDWKKELSSLSGRGKEAVKTATTTVV